MISIAQNPAQPAATQYPLPALYPYRVYDRAAYEQSLGEQPRRYDPAKPTKTWFAPDATDFVVYNDVTRQVESLTLDTFHSSAREHTRAVSILPMVRLRIRRTFLFFNAPISLTDPRVSVTRGKTGTSQSVSGTRTPGYSSQSQCEPTRNK